MPTYIEPLDFNTIFLGYFLGSTQLFAYFFVIVISYTCAKYQVSNLWYLTILGLGSIMFGIYLGEGLFIVILLIMGLVIFKPLVSYLIRS